MSKPNTPHIINAYVYMELDGEVRGWPLSGRKMRIQLHGPPFIPPMTKGVIVKDGRPVELVGDKWLYRVRRVKKE